MRFAPVIAVAALVSTPLAAHPRLIAASPAPNATVVSPARLQLNFSERLVARFSGADVLMTQMRGMKMNAPMKIRSTSALAANGKSLVVSPARPLSAGAYRVDYHVVSTDTHRVQGGYAFTVK